MLWACLLFRDLPLHAVFDDAGQDAPCAVVDGPAQRPQIAFVGKSAHKAGIRPGHQLAVARAVCSKLQTRPRDRIAEKRLLQSLAAWAYRFSSQVALSGDNGLLIEIGASLRLFDGWPALERRLRREIAQIGFAPTLAVAPIPAAARALAVYGEDIYIDQRQPMLSALDRIPLTRCELDKASVSLLYNVGLRTLREVFALPRPELARRIGPSELKMLDRMRGAEQEILDLYQPPARFENRIELEQRVETWPPLLFPLRRLCGELALFLTARDGGVQRCDLVLDHEDHPSTRLAIELLTPQREARTLYELIRSRLEHAAIAHPVCAIALIAKDLPDYAPRHKDLFEPQREQGLEWPELAERLRAHLGDDSVRGIAIAADHRPQRQHVWRCDIEAAGRRPQVPAEAGKPRPLWLLARALPLPDTDPCILAGPERIETGWWDGEDTRRDYYIVQMRDGQRAWAFRERDEDKDSGWMLHGWFA